MAATQSPNQAPVTSGSDGIENISPETTATSVSADLPHAEKSYGLASAAAKQDVGTPPPKTSDVVNTIDPGKKKNDDSRKEETGPPGEERVVNCDGDHPNAGDLFWGALGDNYTENMKNGGLNERRKTAKLRLMQSKAYKQLLEERVTELEREVQRIQKKPLLPVTDDSNYADKIPITCPRIDILSWAEFRTVWKVDKKDGLGWTHRPEVDTMVLMDKEQLKGIIEILREEPRSSWEFKAGIGLLSNGEQVQTIPNLSGPPAPQGQVLADVEPHRIRIRSKLLLKLLVEITGCNTVTGPFGHRLVLLRPFKLLITYEKQLKDYLSDLDKLHSPAADTRGNNSKSSVAGPIPETKSLEAREYLKILCQVVNVNLQAQVELYRHLSPEIQKVGFHDLWHIFKPGYEVRTRDKGQIQLYRVIQVTGGRDTLSLEKAPEVPASEKLKEQGYSPGAFVIECFYIHFDGSRYGPVNATFQIRRFEGKKNVTSLPIYPIQCDPDQLENRQRLLARGNEFAKLSDIKSKASAHRKYKGLTLDKNQEQVDSEIIIDFQLAFLRMKDDKPNIGIDGLVGDDYREIVESWKSCTVCDRIGCCGNDIIFADYEIDNKERGTFRESKKHLFEFIDDEENLTPEHRVLLPSKVHGFVLRTRKWATFDIDLISHPDYISGWPQLVIDEDNKKTVLALVDNHERPGPEGDMPARQNDHVLSSVDLVQGKGRGLIILLHGEPGVGKTSTAECVAAHSKRPLFPITCGDIGDKAQDVEGNLEQNFQLAHKWGCVLLLDEADIFLSMRNEEDIQRNAIVSVFLRTLEYYSGILFLTTNRVGKIDRAFKSRIHLSLYYPKFNQASTLSIWRNNLDRVKEEFDKENKKIDLGDRDNIVKKTPDWAFGMEGKDADFILKAKNAIPTPNSDSNHPLTYQRRRQIRNAFQTAIAIATYEAKEASRREHGDKSDKAVIPKLRVEHFKKVAQSARQFDRYLNSVNSGKTEAQLAKQYILRHDEFKSSETDDDAEDHSSMATRKRRKASNRNEQASSSVSSGSNSASSSDSSDSEAAPKTKKRRKH